MGVCKDRIQKLVLEATIAGPLHCSEKCRWINGPQLVTDKGTQALTCRLFDEMVRIDRRRKSNRFKRCSQCRRYSQTE